MMTKDHANAIMFAYRYDNLTISESLFKQMIGDIAIMRNPWPIFSIAALSGAACLIYDPRKKKSDHKSGMQLQREPQC